MTAAEIPQPGAGALRPGLLSSPQTARAGGGDAASPRPFGKREFAELCDAVFAQGGSWGDVAFLAGTTYAAARMRGQRAGIENPAGAGRKRAFADFEAAAAAQLVREMGTEKAARRLGLNAPALRQRLYRAGYKMLDLRKRGGAP